MNLSWTAGSSNGSPISEYKVSWGGDGSGEKSCGSVTSCQITGLKNGKTYSFKVQAKNEVGWSEGVGMAWKARLTSFRTRRPM